ncbi:MAG: zinc ABC transporter ATP-binding protein ZnuC [Kiloniellaceae bacterium]
MASDPAPGASNDLLVEVSGLEVRFGRTLVLEHVDLTVRGGEIVSLIGPNGAGKSTLVRALVGLLTPTRGRVWKRPGLRLGYVPQRLAVDRVLPLTVRRFLALSGQGAGAAIRAVLKEVAAADLAEAAVHDLSGGEFQRVLLARALLREPQLLVLDEPLQGVDFGGQLALYDLIAKLHTRRGMGVLMVSHDLHIVMGATDRVVCLNHHVCCSGAPEAVSRHPEYVAMFGPEAARRVAVYMHEHDHEHDLAGHVVPAAGGRGDDG